MDHRDEPTWIAIELTRLGETKVEDGTLESAIRKDLGVDGNFPLFVPATGYTKNNRTITIHLMEGYVFVGSGLSETEYFNLEKKPYIGQVMSTRPHAHKMRVLSVIEDNHIQEMRTKLRSLASADIEVDAEVRITEGPYKYLEGSVLGLDADNAFVKIKLRSLEVIATIPRIFLEECFPA